MENMEIDPVETREDRSRATLDLEDRSQGSFASEDLETG